MEERNHPNMEPWDRDFYETGSTKPPKSHGGAVAVLLIAVILLCSAATALGIMNIKLYRKLQEDPSVSFSAGTQPTGNPTEPSDAPPVPTGGSLSLDLQPTPGEVANVSQEGGLSYQEIYEKNIPSVVSITCTLSGGTASGTGVVLSADGYLVTNSHVVEGARTIRVRFTDDRVMTASLVGADTVSDLAVLYVEADDLIPAEFGDSSRLRVGDAVAAIGDPLGEEFRGTMTDGIVSAINRDVTTGGRTMTLIQTNAALNSGNSGGPLINCYGQVVGINTMKISTFVDGAGVEGLGFAIPSTTVKEIVDQLIAQGYVSGRPDLGVTGESVSQLNQRYYRLPAGFLISEVEPGSGAANAGIVAGDIIVTFNGTRIQSADELEAALYACQAGDSVELTLYRYRTGRQFGVKLTLEEADG